MAATDLPEHDTVNIVLVGSFNPRIYQPAWLASQGLIPKSESVNANIQLISNDVCIYDVGWFRLEVLNDRWSLSSVSTPVFEVLRDLAVGVFERLPDEGVSRMGLNAVGHFPLADHKMYNEVGNDMAPKAKYWDPILRAPGMLSLTVRGERPDGYTGSVNVKVEPSSKLSDGIFIEVNDDYIIDLEGHTSSKAALEIIRSEWSRHRERVEDVRRHIIGTARGES